MSGPAEFDTQLDKLETALTKVQQAKGSKVKLPGAELNFLVIIEKVRDMMNAALVDKADRDREKLMEVFGGDCARFAKLRAILSTVELSDMNANDQRLRMCSDVSDAVEKVLKEKGLEGKLQQAKDSAARRFSSMPGAGRTEAPAAPMPAPAAPVAPPAPVPAPAPAAAPASPAATPTLTPPPQEERIVTSQGEDFEVGDDVQRSIQVELSCEAKPEVDFGPNGTIVAHVPCIMLRIATECTPAMPVVTGIAPLEAERQISVTIPAAEKIVFDPEQKLPAGGSFRAVGSAQVEVLEFPQSVDAKVGSKSQSPWGSVKLKDRRGESAVHWEVALHGTFSLAQRGKANVLSISVDIEMHSSISGAASAPFSPDGSPMSPPERG